MLTLCTRVSPLRLTGPQLLRAERKHGVAHGRLSWKTDNEFIRSLSQTQIRLVKGCREGRTQESCVPRPVLEESDYWPIEIRNAHLRKFRRRTCSLQSFAQWQDPRIVVMKSNFHSYAQGNNSNSNLAFTGLTTPSCRRGTGSAPGTPCSRPVDSLKLPFFNR